MKRRLLLIGHPYPDTNMGGVRLRRIAKWLTRLGWEPIVLTHRTDPKALGELPKGVRLIEAAAPDLARIYQSLRHWGRKYSGAGLPKPNEPQAQRIGLTSKINRWVMIPDKQVVWYNAAVREGRRLLQREKVDVIFASQDPRTCLLVAAQLSRETGVPCVMEYRDLWTGSPYYHLSQPTALHRWLHERLERRALRQASRVSAVCRGIADYLSRKHATILKTPVELNYNFFDPEEYSAASTPRTCAPPFIVSYTGAVYGSRTPNQFFDGLRAFIDQTTLSPGQFRFRWAGSIVGIRGLDETLHRTALRPYIDFLGQIPHREALAQVAQSHVALLIQAPDDTVHIPGKLFEAMGARVPLLALANPCETTEIIEQCHTGVVCGHNASGVAAALAELYGATREEEWAFNEAERERFSADTAVRRLAALFDQTAGSRP